MTGGLFLLILGQGLELHPGIPDLGEKILDGLLGAAQGVVHIVIAGLAQLGHPQLGLHGHFLALGLGLLINFLLGDQLGSFLPGGTENAFRFPASLWIRSFRESTMVLGTASVRQAVAHDLVQHIQDLVPLHHRTLSALRGCVPASWIRS